jgi:hypothetical protein
MLCLTCHYARPVALHSALQAEVCPSEHARRQWAPVWLDVTTSPLPGPTCPWHAAARPARAARRSALRAWRVASQAACRAGVRWRLRGTPRGGMGAGRGDASAWEHVKSGFIFPILRLLHVGQRHRTHPWRSVRLWCY